MPKVLYAEDEPTIAAMVRDYLAVKAPEFQLEVVPDGRTCLQRMGAGGIDVLLVDLVLPDIDGLQIITELAARGDATPAVMISSHGQNALAVQALRAGAVDCIDKSTSQVLEVGTILRHVHARHCQAALAARHAPPPRGRRHVVCFESAAGTRAKWGAFLAQHAAHLDVTLVGTRREFHDLLRGERRTDAVVLGLSLAGASPLDLLRELRALPEEIPSVVVSTSVDSYLAVAAMKLGARDVIRYAPDCLPELVAALTAALRQSDLERMNRLLVEKLERINQSLEAEVARRTRELVSEIEVRKEAEARLAALSSRLLRVQENERRAVARELHDHLGQTLTGLKLQVEQAQRQQPVPEAAGVLGEVAATAQRLLHEVRAITQQLRPQILDDLGLGPAIEWHARLYERQTGITVQLDLSLPPGRLGPELELAAFRVTQEALTNVARHSGANTAGVTITADAEKLHVEVTDRGRGFEVAAAAAGRTSIGLAGMHERVGLVGGRLEIFSQPGSGTRVNAEFPLTAAAP